MKKLVLAAVAALLFVIIAPDVAAGEVTNRRLLGLDNYINYFSDNRPPIDPNSARIAANYTRVVENEVRSQVATLDGDLERIDTALEWALASYYSPAIIQIRPAEADAILPANNPRLAGLRLASATLHELTELRFLTPQDTAAIGRYEGMIRFIQDRHGLTRADIDNHYREAIRAEVSKIMDEEFNKIQFSLSLTAVRTYNSVLARNPQNGHYTLSYERPSVPNSNRVLTAPTLEALLSAMQRNSADFVQSDIDTVRTQAGWIPAVASPVFIRNESVDVIVAFYLNPNMDTALALTQRWRELSRLGYQAASASFSAALRALNPEIAARVLSM